MLEGTDLFPYTSGHLDCIGADQCCESAESVIYQVIYPHFYFTW